MHNLIRTTKAQRHKEKHRNRTFLCLCVFVVKKTGHEYCPGTSRKNMQLILLSTYLPPAHVSLSTASLQLCQDFLQQPFGFLFQLQDVGLDLRQWFQRRVGVEIFGEVDFIADFVLAAVQPGACLPRRGL